MNWHRVFLLAALGPSAILAAESVDVLGTAKRLAAERFVGYTYGSTGDKKLDCVHFVAAVVDELAQHTGSALAPSQKKQLAIQLSTEDAQKLQELVAAGDKKIRGVQGVLVDAGFGRAVEPQECRAGQFTQYWYKSGSDWHWHAGIIQTTDGKEATIYGSHEKSLESERHTPEQDRKGGIGSGPVITLTGTSRKIFIVRWTKPPS